MKERFKKMKKKTIILTLLCLFFCLSINNSKCLAQDLDTEESVAIDTLKEQSKNWDNESDMLSSQNNSSVNYTKINSGLENNTVDSNMKSQKLEDEVLNFQNSIVAKITNILFYFSILSSILCFVLITFKFGASGTNPNARAVSMTHLLTSLACVAVLGSVKIITLLIMNIAF